VLVHIITFFVALQKILTMKHSLLFIIAILCFSLNYSSITMAQSKMNYVLHKAETRGETKAGWLLAKHSFTFNNWYDPDRMNFGALRVLNDDWIEKGKGFPTHPHNNMEIITIVLEGSLLHKDNMGNSGIINAGDVQVMSAGTGITHSEANASKTEDLRVMQIWVIPNKKNVQPRYQQINNGMNNLQKNTWKKVVSPTDKKAAFVYQNTEFVMGQIDKGKKVDYPIAFKGNGVYAFILEGSALINGIPLSRRDGLGVWDVEKISVEAKENLKLLLIDVPML
jgi:quercetin 2,3-dioxygenase